MLLVEFESGHVELFLKGALLEFFFLFLLGGQDQLAAVLELFGELVVDERLIVGFDGLARGLFEDVRRATEAV